MANECHLVVPGQLEQLETIREFVVQAAQQTGLDDRQVFQVQMSVDEACANIVEHAYQGTQGGDIVLHCRWTEDEFTVIIHDYGRPFDPTCVPLPNLSSDLEARKCGGLGLYFMYEMMDQVRFEFEDARNTLTMVKRIVPNKEVT